MSAFIMMLLTVWGSLFWLWGGLALWLILPGSRATMSNPAPRPLGLLALGFCWFIFSASAVTGLALTIVMHGVEH